MSSSTFRENTPAVLLHLLPGVLISIAYYLVAPAVMRAGLPVEVAFLASVVVVGWPAIYLVLRRAAAAEGGGWKAILPFRQSIPAWQYVLLLLALIAAAFALLPVGQMVSTALSDHLPAWIPTWIIDPDANPYGHPARQAVLATLVVKLLIDGIANPIAEEIYFRGYLLPKLAGLGFGAPLLNTALFALGHGWQLQNAPLIFLVFLPIAIVAWWRRSMYLSMGAHMALNSIGAVLSLVGFFGGA